MVAEIDLGTGEEWLPDELGKPTLYRQFWATMPEEPRLRHTYIMAGTGSGKSELLKLLIHHEMTARRAVVVIDAHSDLCEQIARWPEFADSNRVVYITPTLANDRMPVINPLQAPKGATDRTKEIIADRLARTIGEICSGIGSDDMSVGMEIIANAALRVLLDLECPTFVDLRRLMSEEPPEDLMKRGREHRSEEVRDVFKSDWMASDYRASKGAIKKRLRNLLLQSDFRQMTCGPSTIPFYKLAETGHTMLFSLGAAGTDASQTIGKLVVSMATIVGDLRKTTAENDRKPLHVFMDECQNFTGPSTLRILEELRKYRVFLTLANQDIKQLSGNVQTGILSNAGVVIMGDGDANAAMLRKMRTDVHAAQTLEPRKFLVRWGSRRTFTATIRSDLALRQDGLQGTDWLAFKATQRRKFYAAPVVTAWTPEPESSEWDALEEFSREVE